jgi:hypothetical protein
MIPCIKCFLASAKIKSTRGTFILLIILSSLLIGSKPKPILFRLTIVNKSGLPIEMRLTGSYLEDNQYYLRIAEGDTLAPSLQIFTILPDKYSIQLYYIELWDPVYGYHCGSKSMTVDVFHNTRLTVTSCDVTPNNQGEPGMWKFGARTSRGRR